MLAGIARAGPLAAHEEVATATAATIERTACLCITDGGYVAAVREWRLKYDGGAPSQLFVGPVLAARRIRAETPRDRGSRAARPGDGDVTAPLVYVNYGMPDDYKAHLLS